MAQRNINVVAITGNLTRDPEHKVVGNDFSICELSVAVNGSEKQGDEWVDRAEFFDVTVFGALADNCAEYLSKGRPVAVHGRLRQDRWVDKETNKNRSKVKIVAHTVQFLSSGEERTREESTKATAQVDPKGDYPGIVGPDDDIPF